jgi:hypothetical protein
MENFFVDFSTNLIYTILGNQKERYNMKTLRLYAATLLAIKEHAENKESFSARDIKDYIDGKLEDGEWELVSGHPIVKHDTIRQYVHEIMDNGLVTLKNGNYKFVKDYGVNSLGDSYKKYSVLFIDETPQCKNECEGDCGGDYENCLEFLDEDEFRGEYEDEFSSESTTEKSIPVNTKSKQITISIKNDQIDIVVS